MRTSNMIHWGPDADDRDLWTVPDKYMTVAALRALLATLPETWELRPNPITRNLVLHSPDGEPQGWIDFAEERWDGHDVE